MSLEIVNLDEHWQAAAVGYLRRSPYRNAVPLSNVTQLRSRCEVLVAHRNGMVQGVASYYRDLPFPALAFAADPGDPLGALLSALIDRLPHLRGADLSTLIPEQRVRQLAGCAQILSGFTEMQMVVEPETLRPREAAGVRRLRPEDRPAMAELAAAGGLSAWSAEAFDHGPAFGAFAADQLVAMATTRFATPDVIEIGNVVTHPEFRRQGFSSGCVTALSQACFVLAPRVYLMVVSDNEPAFQSYRKLGFWPAERFMFVTFRV